jgi:hypothetical protein
MLNGLRVDFDKTQGLICKEIMSHASGLQVDSLKTYGLVCKSRISSRILTIGLGNRTAENC